MAAASPTCSCLILLIHCLSLAKAAKSYLGVPKLLKTFLSVLWHLGRLNYLFPSHSSPFRQLGLLTAQQLQNSLSPKHSQEANHHRLSRGRGNICHHLTYMRASSSSRDPELPLKACYTPISCGDCLMNCSHRHEHSVSLQLQELHLCSQKNQLAWGAGGKTKHFCCCCHRTGNIMFPV